MINIKKKNISAADRFLVAEKRNSAVLHFADFISKIRDFPSKNRLQTEMTRCNQFHFSHFFFHFYRCTGSITPAPFLWFLALFIVRAFSVGCQGKYDKKGLLPPESKNSPHDSLHHAGCRFLNIFYSHSCRDWIHYIKWKLWYSNFRLQGMEYQKRTKWEFIFLLRCYLYWLAIFWRVHFHPKLCIPLPYR